MLEFKNIDGWFNFSKLYSEMVEKSPHTAHFIELGVWKGASAAHMSNEIYKSKKNIKFDAIDWFKGSVEHEDMNDVFPKNLSFAERENWLYNECINNLELAIKLNIVNVIKLDVKSAVKLYDDNSIDFCFHDASHEYDDLIAELPLWWNKIKPGGYFAGHDYGNWSFVGVSRAVNKLAEQHDLHVVYRANEDSWLIQKPFV
jgi:hypothetical protein